MDLKYSKMFQMRENYQELCIMNINLKELNQSTSKQTLEISKISLEKL